MEMCCSMGEKESASSREEIAAEQEGARHQGRELGEKLGRAAATVELGCNDDERAEGLGVEWGEQSRAPAEKFVGAQGRWRDKDRMLGAKKIRAGRIERAARGREKLDRLRDRDATRK